MTILKIILVGAHAFMTIMSALIFFRGKISNESPNAWLFLIFYICLEIITVVVLCV